MRRPLLALLAALTLSACGDPCEDLGKKFCSCVGTGTTKDACVRGVKDELDRINPGGDKDAFCEDRIAICEAHEPKDATFCEWIFTDCGKAACGLSVEDPEDPAICEPAP